MCIQEGKELSAKAKADAAVKNEAIKAQLARQLAERASAEQQEKQEEMDYAKLEQVGWQLQRLNGCGHGVSCVHVCMHVCVGLLESSVGCRQTRVCRQQHTLVPAAPVQRISSDESD
jgi:hypothetical protein